jgi:ribosomal protein S6--L-glutamate ligase
MMFVKWVECDALAGVRQNLVLYGVFGRRHLRSDPNTPSQARQRQHPCYGVKFFMASTRRVGILSRQRSLYSTARLIEATRQAGARPLVLDTLRCTLVVGPQPSLLIRGAEVRGLEVAIPRIGASVTGYGLAVVNQLDAMGVPVMNGAAAIARSRDKMRCLQLLVHGGLAVPTTVMTHGLSSLKQAVAQVGGLPCIVKLLRGTQGVGVMLASTLSEAESFVRTFTALGHDVCLQAFVRESKGRDVRCLVVGDTVVGAMRRVAKPGEFRSNLHRGGEGTAITVAPDYARVAVAAARVVGLAVCGVDLLEGNDGPLVMELNSSPGFEGLERASGIDVAGAMVRHALTLARSDAAVS